MDQGCGESLKRKEGRSENERKRLMIVGEIAEERERKIAWGR